MTRARFALSLPVSIALMLVAGCATKSEPKVHAPHPAVAAPLPATNTTPALAGAPAPEAAPPAVNLAQVSVQPSAPFEGEGWVDLFDGKSLKGWDETAFGGRGKIECKNGLMLLNMGDPFTGVNWTNKLPKINYEVAFDAMRVAGGDFFCGLTVPVNDSFCSLIVGGWGGSLVGISSIDGQDASENETTKFINFENGRWYRIRLRVTDDRLEGWIDNEKIINATTTNKRISLRAGEIELSKPFGLASWQTTSALRQIKIRRVNTPAGPPKKEY